MEYEECEKCGSLIRHMHCDVCKKQWPDAELESMGWIEIRMVNDPEPDFLSLCICPKCIQKIAGKSIAEKIKSIVDKKGEVLVHWGGV